MAMILGHRRGGKLGLFLAGISFILPAMVLVMILGYFYKLYGDLPRIQATLDYIKPVIIAIILVALIKLFKTAINDQVTFLIFVCSLALIFLKTDEFRNMKQLFLKIKIYLENEHKKSAVNFARFMAMALSTILERVVSLRFVRMRPAPKRRFNRLKPRSPSTQVAPFIQKLPQSMRNQLKMVA